MSGWGKGPPKSVMTALTPEEERQRKIDAAVQARQARAQTLCNNIESCLLGPGGTSINYPGDLLYTVDGTWSADEANAASQLWLAFHYNNIHALTVHVLPPILKHAGMHAGKTVVDYIRNQGINVRGRYIIHVIIK